MLRKVKVKMPGCCAVGCTNRTEKGFSLKIIPKDPFRRKLWAFKIRRVNERNQVWSPPRRSFVCEVLDRSKCTTMPFQVHFEDDQWEDRDLKKLKPDAVPTIFEYNKKKLKEEPLQKKRKYSCQKPKSEAVSSELQEQLVSANYTISYLEAKLLSTNQDFADLKKRMDEEILSSRQRIFTLTEENKKLKEQLEQSTKLIKAFSK
ncbi:hypothetical protein JTE90_011308 [Oedothorax gibbosus]|uniref:THAP-type domain-containing protein n=1 Tax=Oedothorax gibbosus TaxID=931172 RepID=A0AAV6VMW6_9ARAC|nr:hypothetical protein JTE90_011308 [Oedothorax gibbosus]